MIGDLLHHRRVDRELDAGPSSTFEEGFRARVIPLRLAEERQGDVRVDRDRESCQPLPDHLALIADEAEGAEREVDEGQPGQPRPRSCPQAMSGRSP